MSDQHDDDADDTDESETPRVQPTGQVSVDLMATLLAALIEELPNRHIVLMVLSEDPDVPKGALSQMISTIRDKDTLVAMMQEFMARCAIDNGGSGETQH